MLGRQTQQTAAEKNWPGLATDVQAIGEQIKIKYVNKYEILKKNIQEATYEEHYSIMMKQFEASTKLKDIQGNNFRQLQVYFKDTTKYCKGKIKV